MNHPHISVLIQRILHYARANHIRQQSPLNRRLGVDSMYFPLNCIITVAALHQSHFIRITTLILSKAHDTKSAALQKVGELLRLGIEPSLRKLMMLPQTSSLLPAIIFYKQVAILQSSSTATY